LRLLKNKNASIDAHKFQKKEAPMTLGGSRIKWWDMHSTTQRPETERARELKIEGGTNRKNHEKKQQTSTFHEDEQVTAHLLSQKAVDA
jgi:hypothetical protein